MDFYACICYFWENCVDSEICFGIWSFQREVRGDHPSCYKNLAFSCHDGIVKIWEVIFAIYEEFGVAVGSEGSEASKSVRWYVLIYLKGLA